MLPILLLLGFVLLFAYHLFLNLFLILFSDFVSHCVTPFHCYLPFCPCHFHYFPRTIQSWVKVYARPSRSQRKKFALKRPKILGHIRTPFDYFERSQALLGISRGILGMVVNAKYFPAYFERLPDNRTAVELWKKRERLEGMRG